MSSTPRRRTVTVLHGRRSGRSPAPGIPGRGAFSTVALFQLAALRERPSGNAERLSVDGYRAICGATHLALSPANIRIRGKRIGDQLVVVLSGHDSDPEVRLPTTRERDRTDRVDVAQVRGSGRLLTEPAAQGLHLLGC